MKKKMLLMALFLVWVGMAGCHGGSGGYVRGDLYGGYPGGHPYYAAPYYYDPFYRPLYYPVRFYDPFYCDPFYCDPFYRSRFFFGASFFWPHQHMVIIDRPAPGRTLRGGRSFGGGFGGGASSGSGGGGSRGSGGRRLR